jgi:hypothetical protein
MSGRHKQWMLTRKETCKLFIKSVRRWWRRYRCSRGRWGSNLKLGGDPLG